MNLGAAFAKQIFPLIGPNGMTALRIMFAALLLLVTYRPWRRMTPNIRRWELIGYGAALGLMNLFIYQAFARIPIGIATGIEVLGPLLVVLAGTRSLRDLIWLAMAVTGLILLLPLRTDQMLDPAGLMFAGAAACCWALYIIYGKRVSHVYGRDAVAWGMCVAALLTTPFGLTSAGWVLLNPNILALGLAIALLSSAIPYTLEMEALRRLPAPIFGILVSSAPAVAALAGFIILGEALTPLQWLAIFCIMLAAAGSAWSNAKRENNAVAVGEV